jgi:hypothetical protein
VNGGSTATNGNAGGSFAVNGTRGDQNNFISTALTTTPTITETLPY